MQWPPKLKYHNNIYNIQQQLLKYTHTHLYIISISTIQTPWQHKSAPIKTVLLEHVLHSRHSVYVVLSTPTDIEMYINTMVGMAMAESQWFLQRFLVCLRRDIAVDMNTLDANQNLMWLPGSERVQDRWSMLVLESLFVPILFISGRNISF